MQSLLLACIAGCAAAGNAILDRLNNQYVAGKPSDNMTESGLLIHMFDNLEPHKPSSADPMGTPWLPCRDDPLDWCQPYSDRISSSIISKDQGGLFKPTVVGGTDKGGMIMSTSVLQDGFFCAWAEDGNTMARKCTPPGESSSCIPGCYSQAGLPCWCEDGHNDCQLQQPVEESGIFYREPTLAPTPNQWYCPHTPADLKLALAAQAPAHDGYNEIVVSAKAYTAALPRSIEAFVYRKKYCLNECLASITAAHTAVLAAYKLTPSQLPLLMLDLEADPALTCVKC